MDIYTSQEEVEKNQERVSSILREVKKNIVGQDKPLNRIIIAILSSGHILIEGVPGLAKTLMAKSISRAIDCSFSRIQFTPDLLPADVIGTMIFNQKTGNFYAKKGPIFASIVLADEINRAPAKTQSALLEAMQESQVTIGDSTYPLDEPFIVIATQNPIEQHGTYPLPEAQVDRFMMKIKIDYPSKHEEHKILKIHGEKPDKDIKINPVIKKNELKKIKESIRKIYIDDKIEEYILNIVFATRYPEEYGLPELKDIISFGASPRASLYLKIASQAQAFLNRRNYVIPEDVQEIALDILRHRIILSYEAQAEDIDPDIVVEKVLNRIDVP